MTQLYTIGTSHRNSGTLRCNSVAVTKSARSPVLSAGLCGFRNRRSANANAERIAYLLNTLNMVSFPLETKCQRHSGSPSFASFPFSPIAPTAEQLAFSPAQFTELPFTADVQAALTSLGRTKVTFGHFVSLLPDQDSAAHSFLLS